MLVFAPKQGTPDKPSPTTRIDLDFAQIARLFDATVVSMLSDMRHAAACIEELAVAGAKIIVIRLVGARSGLHFR